MLDISERRLRDDEEPTYDLLVSVDPSDEIDEITITMNGSANGADGEPFRVSFPGRALDDVISALSSFRSEMYSRQSRREDEARAAMTPAVATYESGRG